MIDKTNGKCPIQVARAVIVNKPPLPGEVPIPLPVQVHAVAGFHQLTIAQARYLANELIEAANDAELRRGARCACGGQRGFEPVYAIPNPLPVEWRCIDCGVRRP